MGNLNVTNINGQKPEAGKIKAWFNFNQQTNTVMNSLNCTSFIDAGVGITTVNWVNGFSGAYSAGGASKYAAATEDDESLGDLQNTFLRMENRSPSTPWVRDLPLVTYMCAGDLA